MRISRRNFGLGLGVLGLSACGNSSAMSFSGAAPLAADLRPTHNPGWDAWVDAFRARASGYGLSDATVSTAFRGAGYLPGVVTRDRSQTETSRTLEDYLSISVSDERVAKGRAAFARQRGTLSALQDRFGVDAAVIAAIWGVESL